MRELVKEGSTGLLFKPGDVDDFVAKATQMIDDAALRDRFGKQGRVTMLEEKDWAQIGKRYRGIYTKAGAKP
jgi:glycosyltransferase involved in cell wall biosynthesis